MPETNSSQTEQTQESLSNPEVSLDGLIFLSNSDRGKIYIDPESGELFVLYSGILEALPTTPPDNYWSSGFLGTDFHPMFCVI